VDSEATRLPTSSLLIGKISVWLSEKFGKEVSRLLSYVRERGQGLVEYALILLLVVLVVIAVVTLLGPIVGNMFSKVNSNMPK